MPEISTTARNTGWRNKGESAPIYSRWGNEKEDGLGKGRWKEWKVDWKGQREWREVTLRRGAMWSLLSFRASELFHSDSQQKKKKGFPGLLIDTTETLLVLWDIIQSCSQCCCEKCLQFGQKQTDNPTLRELLLFISQPMGRTSADHIKSQPMWQFFVLSSVSICSSFSHIITLRRIEGSPLEWQSGDHHLYR